MPVGALVQARMTSSRLPGKVLLPAAGKPLLAHLLHRLQGARRLDGIVVACTDRAADDPIAALCAALDVPVFRGPEDDVLVRFTGAAALLPECDLLLRVTSDCPLLDGEVVDAHIAALQDGPEPADYVWCGEPPVLPNGLCLEGFRRALLFQAQAAATTGFEREHVTPWMRAPGRTHRIRPAPLDIGGLDYRLCVDTAEDYALVQAVFEALYPADPQFSARDAVALLDARPQLAALNADCGQKTGPYRRSA